MEGEDLLSSLLSPCLPTHVHASDSHYRFIVILIVLLFSLYSYYIHKNALPESVICYPFLFNFFSCINSSLVFCVFV